MLRNFIDDLDLESIEKQERFRNEADQVVNDQIIQ
jgi:hypothetical protein